MKTFLFAITSFLGQTLSVFDYLYENQNSKDMNTEEVAKKWRSMCQEGKNLDCINELYAENVKSREMSGSPYELIEGKQNVWNKSKIWMDNVQEFHGSEISEPTIADNHFTSKIDFDVTLKDKGRQKLEELGVFEVKDGKIVNEQFFYSM